MTLGFLKRGVMVCYEGSAFLQGTVYSAFFTAVAGTGSFFF